MRRQIGCTALIVVSSAWLLAQETNQPTFRTGVELVQLDVTVLDDKRQAVRGLSVSDFTVLEDGVPRPIRAFTAVDVPARARAEEPIWANDVVRDVATNHAAAQEGRLVIILMDRSIPYQGLSVAAQRIAIAAVEALGPNDLGALVSTSGVYTPQNFTADRRRLVNAIMQRDWSTESGEFPWSLDDGGDGRCICGLCVLETLTRVSEAVRDAPRRRKVLLFIGRGIAVNSPPRSPTVDPGCERMLDVARQKLYDSLALSNLTVHSIDPRGLENIGDHTKASVSGAGIDRAVNNAQVVRRQQLIAAINDTLRTQDSLRILPERTGGRTVVNTNAPDGQVPEIFRESEAYYLLGFERGAVGEARRSIEVRVGRKGVRAHAQRQHVLAGPPASPGVSLDPGGAAVAAERAISGLLPRTGVPLALSTAVFAKHAGEGGLVSISVDASAFAGDVPTPLDIAVIVLDQTGRQVGSARQTSTLSARTPGTSRAELVNVQSHVELDSGDYEIRVAVADQKTGAAASVFSQIAIPKFASTPLSVSDIAMEVGATRNASAGTGTLVSILPTTQRRFERAAQVRAFLQIYQGTQRTDPIVPVSLRVRILDARGSARRDQSLIFTERDFRARRTDCQINLPIADLAAGEHLLEITAAAGPDAAARRLRFTVH